MINEKTEVFLNILASKIRSNEKLIQKPKKLKKRLQDIVSNLKEEKLKNSLLKNFDRNFTFFQSLLQVDNDDDKQAKKRKKDAETTAEILKGPKQHKKPPKSKESKLPTATEAAPDQKAAILPYNVYNYDDKAVDLEILKGFSRVEQAEIYSGFLHCTFLDSDEDLVDKAEKCLPGGDRVTWEDKMCVLCSSLVGDTSPDKLQRAMSVFNALLCTTFGEISETAGRKKASLKKLRDQSRKFVQFFHLKFKSIGKAFKKAPLYEDLLAGILATYTDVNIAINHCDPTDPALLGGPLSRLLLQLFSAAPHYVCDVLLQLDEQLEETDAQLLLPLAKPVLEKLAKSGCDSPKLYTKVILTGRLVTNSWPGETAELKQTLQRLSAPKGYYEWVCEGDESLEDSLPGRKAFKRGAATRYILDTLDDDTAESLLDLLIEDEPDIPEEAVEDASKEDRNQETPLFVIDKDPDLDTTQLVKALKSREVLAEETTEVEEIIVDLDELEQEEDLDLSDLRVTPSRGHSDEEDMEDGDVEAEDGDMDVLEKTGWVLDNIGARSQGGLVLDQPQAGDEDDEPVDDDESDEDEEAVEDEESEEEAVDEEEDIEDEEVERAKVYEVVDADEEVVEIDDDEESEEELEDEESTNKDTDKIDGNEDVEMMDDKIRGDDEIKQNSESADKPQSILIQNSADEETDDQEFDKSMLKTLFSPTSKSKISKSPRNSRSPQKKKSSDEMSQSDTDTSKENATPKSKHKKSSRKSSESQRSSDETEQHVNTSGVAFTKLKESSPNQRRSPRKTSESSPKDFKVPVISVKSPKSDKSSSTSQASEVILLSPTEKQSPSRNVAEVRVSPRKRSDSESADSPTSKKLKTKSPKVPTVEASNEVKPIDQEGKEDIYDFKIYESSDGSMASSLDSHRKRVQMKRRRSNAEEGQEKEPEYINLKKGVATYSTPRRRSVKPVSMQMTKLLEAEGVQMRRRKTASAAEIASAMSELRKEQENTSDGTDTQTASKSSRRRSMPVYNKDAESVGLTLEQIKAETGSPRRSRRLSEMSVESPRPATRQRARGDSESSVASVDVMKDPVPTTPTRTSTRTSRRVSMPAKCCGEDVKTTPVKSKTPKAKTAETGSPKQSPSKRRYSLRTPTKISK